MIKIVSFKICPFVQRVTALLEAKSISYEIEYISLKDKPEWFLQLSPNAQVPLLITEKGEGLFESDAIVEYIEDAYTPLQSALTAEQKAKNRAWSYLATKNYLVQCSAMRSSDNESLVDKQNKLTKVFNLVEGQITVGPYFHGDNLSLVDLAWLPLLHRAHIIELHTGYDLLQGLPRVKAWQQAMIELSITSASVADDFEQAFVDFYLSESTVLGQMTNRSSAFKLENQKCDDTCC